MCVHVTFFSVVEQLNKNIEIIAFNCAFVEYDFKRHRSTKKKFNIISGVLDVYFWYYFKLVRRLLNKKNNHDN